MEKYVINILTIFYSYFFSPSYVNAHNFFFFFRTRVLTSQTNQLQKQRNGKTSKISRDPLTYFGPKHKPM